MKHYYVVYFEIYPDQEVGIGSTDAYIEKMDLEQIDQLSDVIAKDNGAERVKIITWRELE
ncbi:hypothetical protein IKE71_03685 [Candidatus Saccharibacteria bacterium]|nr:hypothetical protein [Candidatus Saccharibacteria bacterium]